MLSEIWNDILFQPLFNALIWIYNHWTNASLGWSIVYLTVLLRLALFPFSIFSEWAKFKNRKLGDEINELANNLANDPVLYKEEVRRLLKKKKIRPWAKATLLGVQGLVLVLLYQVFLHGMAGEAVIHLLYPSVSYPGFINTVFYGFSLGDSHNVVWSAGIAILLFVELYIGYKRSARTATKKDLTYAVFFPLGIFVVLYYLPLAKSLFVLTSAVFSLVMNKVIVLIFLALQGKDEN